jgi:hypothetical protein
MRLLLTKACCKIPSKELPIKFAVFALVPSATQAEGIVEELRLSGFSNNDVSVLFPDVEGSREFAHANSTKAPEGAVIGGSAGGLVGGLTGWLIGIGVLAFPGAGPLIAAGPLCAALSGAAVGVAAGGLSGALAGLGFPEYEAKLYAGKLSDGNILIAVHVENPQERIVARQIFERAQAHDISVTSESAVPTY